MPALDNGKINVLALLMPTAKEISMVLGVIKLSLQLNVVARLIANVLILVLVMSVQLRISVGAMGTQTVQETELLVSSVMLQVPLLQMNVSPVSLTMTVPVLRLNAILVTENVLPA